MGLASIIVSPCTRCGGTRGRTSTSGAARLAIDPFPGSITLWIDATDKIWELPEFATLREHYYISQDQEVNVVSAHPSTAMEATDTGAYVGNIFDQLESDRDIEVEEVDSHYDD